jgi:alkanesulfonate monooxygenase SsuD/methylene tetrahydromethanopterin reductase-like flavin-dependent oxidoreductase (luciferase family)
VTAASINSRPTRPVPVWFGGTAPVVLSRCGRIGDGWMPLGGANDKARESLEIIRSARAAAGLSMDGFGVQAQAQFAGGDPERWHSHAAKWRELGATHLAIATHNAGPTDVDGHLDRVRQYLAAVADV